LRNEPPFANLKRQTENIEQSNAEANIATILEGSSSSITRIHKPCVKPSLLQTRLRTTISGIKDPIVTRMYVLPNQI
jgi:hypothetical protein